MTNLKSDLTVTLIGSFRKDKQKLELIFKSISSQFTLLSPPSINFTSQGDSFVRTNDVVKDSVSRIEQKHLAAINASDFVVLHAPSRYVGLSAAAEIGYAYALGIPILADEKPDDVIIQTFISGYIATDGAINVTSSDPGRAVGALQEYYKRIAKRRGWNEETPKDTLVLLMEEVGELARAVRKVESIKRDDAFKKDSAAEELADIQLYLVHLANSLNINLASAVTQKEAKNQARFSKRSSKV